MKRVSAAVAAAISLATVASAKPVDLANQSLSRASTDGAVMFTAPFVPGDYVIMFSPYDKASNTVHGSEIVNVRSRKAVAVPAPLDSVQLHRMPPGFYVVRMITTQSWWGACLSDDTVGFDIKAGQITYLGRIDPAPTLASIQSEAARTGKTTSSGGQLRLFKENVKPPLFTFEGSAQSKTLLAVAMASGLSSDAPVAQVTPTAASYHRTDKTDLTGYCK